MKTVNSKVERYLKFNQNLKLDSFLFRYWDIKRISWFFWSLGLWSSSVRLPSVGIQQRDWESPGNLNLKPVGFDYKTSTGLGETDSSLGGHQQNLAHTKTQRKGSVTPPGDWTKTTCWCWKVSCVGMDWQALTTGMGALAAAVWEGPPWCKPSWKLPLALLKSPYTQGLGSFRPKNYQGGSTTPLISRYLN